MIELTKLETVLLLTALTLKPRGLDRRKKNGNVFDSLLQKGLITYAGQLTEDGKLVAEKCRDDQRRQIQADREEAETRDRDQTQKSASGTGGQGLRGGKNSRELPGAPVQFGGRSRNRR